MSQQTQKQVREIQDTITGLAGMFDNLKAADPVAAKQTFQQMMQYFGERVPDMCRQFTVSELVELGYLPQVN